MKALLALLLVTISFPAFAQTPNYNTTPKFRSTHDHNHNNYTGWKVPGSVTENTPYGQSCCNDRDCDIVKSYWDDAMQLHYIIYDGNRLYVPNKAIMYEKDGSPKRSPDGNSHICIIEYDEGHPTVLCFVLGDPMI